jgi:hypothetical protein
MLLASVAPDVKKISPEEALRPVAIVFLASSITILACLPWRCIDEGLPYTSEIILVISSCTSGSNGVVEALSKYTLIRY